MYDKWFAEANLTVVELPIELTSAGVPRYAAYVRELPFLTAEASSRQQVYQQLASSYLEYREQQAPEEAEKVGTDLTLEEVLKYYDGETFDGYSDYF